MTHRPYTRHPRKYREFARKGRILLLLHIVGPMQVGAATQEYQRARCAYKRWLSAHKEATILNDTYYNQ